MPLDGKLEEGKVLILLVCRLALVPLVGVFTSSGHHISLFDINLNFISLLAKWRLGDEMTLCFDRHLLWLTFTSVGERLCIEKLSRFS